MTRTTPRAFAPAGALASGLRVLVLRVRPGESVASTLAALALEAGLDPLAFWWMSIEEFAAAVARGAPPCANG